jgi:hypothetical protein
MKGFILASALYLFTLLPLGVRGSNKPEHEYRHQRLPEFTRLALLAGTDKTTGHKYQHIYNRYLPERRHDPMNVLEIGLGCIADPRNWGASLDQFY